jgi:hypothetical protein
MQFRELKIPGAALKLFLGKGSNIFFILKTSENCYCSAV